MVILLFLFCAVTEVKISFKSIKMRDIKIPSHEQVII